MKNLFSKCARPRKIMFSINWAHWIDWGDGRKQTSLHMHYKKFAVAPKVNANPWLECLYMTHFHLADTGKQIELREPSTGAVCCCCTVGGMWACFYSSYLKLWWIVTLCVPNGARKLVNSQFLCYGDRTYLWAYVETGKAVSLSERECREGSLQCSLTQIALCPASSVLTEAWKC